MASNAIESISLVNRWSGIRMSSERQTCLITDRKFLTGTIFITRAGNRASYMNYPYETTNDGMVSPKRTAV
jgi:hypothetical protein